MQALLADGFFISEEVQRYVLKAADEMKAENN
jgi:hypothetical protein